MNLNIKTKYQHSNCHHSHVNHVLICHANCDVEDHKKKGYSSTLINFFIIDKIFEQEDMIKTYLSMVESLPNIPSI